MHPAYSVIFFTTSSGFGYGLAFWILILSLTKVVDDQWLGGIGLMIALAAITFGLLASTMHLGNPGRAWRAFSQWRSSWLSREGVVAVLSLVFISLAWLGMVTDVKGNFWVISSWLGILTALTTVLCTGMIYQSLKPIAAWQSRLTTPVYLTYAILTGGFASAALISFFDSEGQLPAALSVIAAITLAGMKISYWKRASRVISLTPESATGLGKLGKVRQLEAPHATANYINKEMGFKIARKHSKKLRKIVLGMGFLAPVILGLIGILNDGLSQMTWSIAALLSIGGAAVERWLFFAEAKHAVSAFYSS